MDQNRNNNSYLCIQLSLQRILEMSRHSIQIKALLESKRLSKTKYNPQNSLKSIYEPIPSVRNLKRSESSSTLRKKGNCQILLIEDRFRKLQENYKIVLEETRQKAILFKKQKNQLEKHKLDSQKDKKEIQRLRAMLGFIKKEDLGVQVDMNLEGRCSFDKDISKISSSSKAQQSTDAGRETSEIWECKERKKSSQKQSRVKTPYKVMGNNKSETTICFRSPQKQSLMKSQLQRFKYVPTISLS